MRNTAKGEKQKLMQDKRRDEAAARLLCEAYSTDLKGILSSNVVT